MTNADNEVLIKVNNVSKKFCRDFKKSLWYGLKDTAYDLVSWGKNQEQRTKNKELALRPSEFWANQEVSFEVRRGECLGLIGRNGAGKTTLLKILNGLIKPDTGSIEMRGRVGALIALGAGFNPILTGRENIYVNGSVLGLYKKEIDAKLEEIIDFAEIEDAIDSPVRTYSSGMQVRLGFAVATTMNPDVLILDEVLAVGDASFRAKCYNRIGKMQKNAAVIFVSHVMDQVSQICNASLLLEDGKAEYCADVSDGLSKYQQKIQNAGADREQLFLVKHPVNNASLSFSHDRLEYGGNLCARLQLDMAESIKGAIIRIPFYSADSAVIAMWNSKASGIKVDLPAGRCVIEINMGPLHLGEGTYDTGLVLNDETGVFNLVWSLRNHKVIFSDMSHGGSHYQLATESFSIHD